jgi:hypothetical protein
MNKTFNFHCGIWTSPAVNFLTVTRRPIGDAVQRRIPHRPRTQIAILVALSSVWAVEEVTRDSLMSSL